MTRQPWIERLQRLVERFPEYGIGPDLGGLAIADLWGLWRFLERIALEVSHGAKP